MQLRLEGIRAADRVCRKLRTGAIPYSPEFAKLTAERNFWNFLDNLKTGKTKRQRRLESYRKLPGLQIALAELKKLNLTTIRIKSKEAYQCYKTFTGRQAEKARNDWMEGLINEQERNENEDRYMQHPQLHSPPHHQLRSSKIEIRTAGSGHKTVKRTGQTASHVIQKSCKRQL
jgi:hypothetical protein